MVHCDSDCTVVSGLAEDFLWEVSGCSCDDAPLKLGGGPSLYSSTGCCRWRAGWPSSLRHTYIQVGVHTHACRARGQLDEWCPMCATSIQHMQTQDVMYNSSVVSLACFTNSKRFVVFNVSYISLFLVFNICTCLFRTKTYCNYDAIDNCFVWTILR